MSNKEELLTGAKIIYRSRLYIKRTTWERLKEDAPTHNRRDTEQAAYILDSYYSDKNVQKRVNKNG